MPTSAACPDCKVIHSISFESVSEAEQAIGKVHEEIVGDGLSHEVVYVETDPNSDLGRMLFDIYGGEGAPQGWIFGVLQAAN